MKAGWYKDSCQRWGRGPGNPASESEKARQQSHLRPLEHGEHAPKNCFMEMRTKNLIKSMIRGALECPELIIDTTDSLSHQN